MERGLTNGLVSVIIVSWNSAHFLERCLAAVGFQTYCDIELIQIDNASSDDSVVVARRAAPQVHQILNDTNRGFSAAVNQGVRAANGEFVLLLNPDAFLEPDYIKNIVAAFAAAGESFGMATGKLLQAETGLIDSKGIRMTISGRHFDIGQGVADGPMEGQKTGPGCTPLLRDHPQSGSGLGAADCIREIFGVSGAAAMYRVSFIRDVTIGGEFLDEDFFTFREDADVAWRGQLFGWRAMYVPDAVGHHVRSVTPEKRGAQSAVTNMHGVKNRFLLRWKNEGFFLALRNAPFELARDLVVIAAALTVERSSLPALSWLWKNRRRIMEKRRTIQGRRRVSDRRIAGWFR